MGWMEIRDGEEREVTESHAEKDVLILNRKNLNIA